MVRRDAHGGKQNVELLAHVHVDGSLRHDAMAIRHGGGGDGFVIVGFHPVQQQVFSREGRGDVLHHGVIFFEVAAAGDDHGHAHSAENGLHNVACFFRRQVAVVGMRRRQAHADYVSAEFLHQVTSHRAQDL